MAHSLLLREAEKTYRQIPKPDCTSDQLECDATLLRLRQSGSPVDILTTSYQSFWKSSNTPEWLKISYVQWDCELKSISILNDLTWIQHVWWTHWTLGTPYPVSDHRHSDSLFWNPLPWRSQSRWVECNFSKSSKDARPRRSAPDSPPSPQRLCIIFAFVYFVHICSYFVLNSYRVAHLSAFILLVSFRLVKSCSC